MALRVSSYLKAFLMPCVLLSPAIGHGQEAERFSTTSLQVGATSQADNDFITGYGADGGDRIQVRFEHQSDNQWGENYFFTDLLIFDNPAGAAFGEGDNGKREIYGLWNGNLRAGRILNREFDLGPINDFSVEARLEYGSFFDYRSTAFGLGMYLDVPGFQGAYDKFQLNWWRRSNCDEFIQGPFGSADGSCYEDHNLWGLTARKYWDMFGLRWNHQTFLRYQQGTTSDDQNPDPAARHDRIFLEVELFARVYKNLQIGTRLEYFWDDGGIDYDRTTFQPNRDTNVIPIFIVKYDFY